ncbi:MAG: hypothetical protein U5K70_09690 [Halodesulfurarchaeum sp.]|nr:hypothetical protein [Halodesulfurarchaeum sp.]
MRRDSQPKTGRDRGQAHVLEGIAAALLVLTSVIFALQVTAVTPLTASTANQHLQTQGSGTASGLLAAADERGTLRETVLYWNETGNRFHDSGDSAQYAAVVPTEFGSTLEAAFRDRGMVYNVNLLYLSADQTQRERKLLHQGDPSDHAVSVTRTVVLYDDDRLRDENETPSNRTVSDADSYFARDTADGPLYNVIRVEVVVWRV